MQKSFFIIEKLQNTEGTQLCLKSLEGQFGYDGYFRSGQLLLFCLKVGLPFPDGPSNNFNFNSLFNSHRAIQFLLFFNLSMSLIFYKKINMFSSHLIIHDIVYVNMHVLWNRKCPALTERSDRLALSSKERFHLLAS